MSVEAKWKKLQQLACSHAYAMYQSGAKDRMVRMRTSRGRLSGSFIVTDSDHRDTVDILGRGDENEMASRIHWYLSYYPKFFTGNLSAKAE
jgi:hypothetical protein